MKSPVLRYVRIALAAATLSAGPGTASAQRAGPRRPPVEAASRRTAAATTGELADDLGDPLPPGAVARLGTVRLRQTMPAFCVAFAHDGNSFATGHGDGTIRIWHARTGLMLARIAGHKKTVSALCFSPDNRKLISGSADQTIRYWNVRTGKQTRRIDTPAGVAGMILSPDRRALFAAAGRTVLLYEAASGNRLDELRRDKPCGGSMAMAMLPDGATLVIGGRDGKIHLLDFKARRELAAIPCKDKVQTFVAASIDGRTLAWGEPGGKVHLVDIATETDIRLLIGHTAGICCLSFSPDWRLLATRSADHTTRIWNVSTGREVRRFESCGILPNSLAFSPDGRYLAAARLDKAVDLWDMKTGKPVLDPPGHTEQVYALAYSPDGKRLASGAVSSGARGNNMIRMWDPATRKEIWRGSKAYGITARQIAWHPDGSRIALRGQDKTVRIWDAAGGRELHVMPKGKRHVTAMTFERDANAVLVARSDGTISRWRYATGEVSEVRKAGRGGAYCMEYSPDGRTLALGHARVTLHDALGLKKLRTLPGGRGVFWNVRFSADGRRLVAGGQGVTMWDVASGAELFTAGAQLGTAWSVDFSPDGHLIVSAHSDGAVGLWEAATGRPIALLRGHEGSSSTYAVAFAPDGRAFCSSGADTQILIWSLVELFGVGTPPSSPEAMETMWQQLADANAAAGFRAVRALAAAGERAVSLIGNRLKAPVLPPEDRVRKLIADLGAGRFATRQRATEELRKLGAAVERQLREARDQTTSAEVRQRTKELLEFIRTPQPLSAHQRQAVRAIAVLEQIGSEKACAVLKKLADSRAQPRVTRDARQALRRLSRQR